MVDEFIHIDMTRVRHPKTGKLQYSKEELERLKPRWKAQWKEYSDLDDEMIGYVVNELHVSPFEHPGNRIAEASSGWMNRYMKRIERKWGKEKRTYTGTQLYREAKIQVNAYARRRGRAKGLIDPLGYMYFFSDTKLRKRRRYEYATV